MSRRWIVLAVILLVWTPSAIYARWIEDKVTLETQEAGKACGACHKGKEAFSVKEQCDSRHDGSTAFGVKDDKFCGKCHEM